jgi:GntR family transcriptional repressor for pyruvate dehydrogenase complex
VYSPIQSSRLYEQIVEQIEQRVLDGVLIPGDKLPSERELCEQFGVSRTVVREAVRALREKGLVDIQPGRGTFITNGTSEAMRNTLGLVFKVGQDSAQTDLIQVRAILEPEFAALAAENATQWDIVELQVAIAAMDKVLDDVDKFIEADQTFHLVLANATHNSLIPLLIDPIVDLLWEQRKRIFLNTGGARRGQYHHKRILEAVIQGDKEAAREAMRSHMEQIREDSISEPNSQK